MDFQLSSELQHLGAKARSVGEAAASKRPVTEDSWLIGFDRRFSLLMAELGWIGMTWPSEYGGHGRTPLERFVVMEALISTGAPVAATWFADRQIGPTLLQFGSEAQKERWLPGIVSGTESWAVGMSEPEAGSDVASIATRAVKRGNDWIVDGRKVWTSGAHLADWLYLVARTDPASRHRGLSEFVVDLKSPGIRIEPILDATGNDHFCEIVLTEVAVPAENLVGIENESFRQVMRQMEHERGGIDRLVSNRSLYDWALSTANLGDPLTRQAVARCETMYTIGRHMVLAEVLGQAPTGWSSITKTLCTEFEIEVAHFCGQVAGSEAMLANRVSRGICYAPAYTLMGGTTQILRNILGERVLGLERG